MPSRPMKGFTRTWVAAVAAQGGELAAAAAACVPEAGAMAGAHDAGGGGARQGLCPGAPSRRRTLSPAGSSLEKLQRRADDVRQPPGRPKPRQRGSTSRRGGTVGDAGRSQLRCPSGKRLRLGMPWTVHP